MTVTVRAIATGNHPVPVGQLWPVCEWARSGYRIFLCWFDSPGTGRGDALFARSAETVMRTWCVMR